MRVFSFAQESTRYCNYTLNKFNKELTFIAPLWCDVEDTNDPKVCTLISFLDNVEQSYFSLLGNWNARIADKRFKTGYRNNPWSPQQAATILPNALKTELLMTGFKEDWLHFFDLRALGTTGAPHPQAKELAEPLMEEFKKRGYIE